MGQGRATRAEGAPDLVITGAVILDYSGVIKADVGVRDGRIAAIGKAGNPDTMDGVTPGLVIGPSTEIVCRQRQDPDSRRDRLPRAPYLPPNSRGFPRCGRDDRHRRRDRAGRGDPGHHSNPGGMEPGPNARPRWMPGPSTSRCWAKGTLFPNQGLWEQLRGGAAGFKLHEDWGSTPAAIDACLKVCELPGSKPPSTPTP